MLSRFNAKRSLSFVIGTLSAPLLMTDPSFATDPSENGDWHLNGLNEPVSLNETYQSSTGALNTTSNGVGDIPAGSQLVDVYFSSTPSFETGALNLTLTNGALSGDASGSYSLGNLGLVTLNVTGDGIHKGYINMAKDTMVVPSLDSPDNYSLNIITRQPASLTTSNLAGTWKFFAMSLPDDLTNVYYNGSSTLTLKSADNTSHPGYQLVDVYYESPAELPSYNVNIDSSGNLSGDLSGSTTINGDQSASLNITGIGARTFYPNSAVDVMSNTNSDTSSYTLAAGVKLPSSLALSELQGVWRAIDMDYPARMVEVYYNSSTGQTRESYNSSDSAGPGEQLVDVYHPSIPAGILGLVSLSAAGNVTGSISGTMAVSGTHLVYTPSNGDPQIAFYPNASKNFMVAGGGDADSVGLITLVKVSAAPAATLDKLVDMKITIQPNQDVSISWNPASKFQLESTTDFSTWTTLGNSGSLTDTSHASSVFYRIKKQ